MENITKLQFDKFTKLQYSGILNMNDSIRGSQTIGESVEVYETIMLNYSKLKSKFKTILIIGSPLYLIRNK